MIERASLGEVINSLGYDAPLIDVFATRDWLRLHIPTLRAAIDVIDTDIPGRDDRWYVCTWLTTEQRDALRELLDLLRAPP